MADDPIFEIKHLHVSFYNIEKNKHIKEKDADMEHIFVLGIHFLSNITKTCTCI
jgi:hypothetical protein